MRHSGIALSFILAGFCSVSAAARPPTDPAGGQADITAPASGRWTKQEPLPTAWQVQDVDMVSASEGWAVADPITGDHGWVLHTTNGGKSWTRQGPLFTQLRTISFADPLHGIALGNELRYTVDGGKTWLQGSGALGSTEDSKLVDSSVGYATAFAAVKKTTDGGKTWTFQPLPLQGNLVGVDFVDASTGWVVGAEGTVFHTTDGGAHWSLQRHDTESFYTGVSFVSASEGWVCGNATILHTGDGGLSWTAQAVPPGADATEVRFVDPQHGWAAGELRTLLHTMDGGQTWSLQLGGVYADPQNRYPFLGLDAVDPMHAVAVGGGNSIFVTANGGQRWLSRASGSPTIPYRMARTDASHLWTANSNSEVLYSVDGGRKWDRSIIQLGLGCDTCSNAADIAFLDNRNGWAVINGDFTTSSWVWRSTDGGKLWQTLGITATGPLSGLAIVDPQTLVAVSGLQDKIFRSTDAGETWAPVPHPAGGGWYGSVRFVPGTQTGWAVGYGGKIVRSMDGGATWTEQRDASHPSNLIDVSFSDTSHGWAVGGEELRTSDGGATWVSVNTGVFASVSVYALSPAVAWVGGLGSLGRTVDGGATWTIEEPSDTDWFAMTFVSQEIGWAGGQDQALDDVPGSVWKRVPSSATLADPRSEDAPVAPREARPWLTPPSGGR